MSDEVIEQTNAPEQVVVEGTPVQEKPQAYQGVISKPEQEIPPGHTAETWAIQQERMKENEGKETSYSYSANGYTVTERKAEGTEKAIAEDGNVYEVTGNGMDKRVYGNKRQAEIFAETHSPSFAQQSATMPSA